MINRTGDALIDSRISCIISHTGSAAPGYFVNRYPLMRLAALLLWHRALSNDDRRVSLCPLSFGSMVVIGSPEINDRCNLSTPYIYICTYAYLRLSGLIINFDQVPDVDTSVVKYVMNDEAHVRNVLLITERQHSINKYRTEKDVD